MLSHTLFSMLRLYVLVASNVAGLQLGTHSDDYLTPSPTKQPVNTIAPVYADGITKREFKLHELYGNSNFTAFPTGMYFRFKMSPWQKEHSNKSHIRIRRGDLLNMLYVKHWQNGEKSYCDFGKIDAVAFTQKDGSYAFSPDIKAGFAEKRHVLNTSKKEDDWFAEWKTIGSSLMQNVQQDNVAETAKESVSKLRRSVHSHYGISSAEVNMFEQILKSSGNGPQLAWFASLATLFAPQMLGAAGIPNRDIKEFAKKSKTIPANILHLVNVGKYYLSKHIDAGDLKKKSLYSMLNCFHFEDVAWDEVSESMIYPLDRLLPAYRGETTEKPYESYDLLQGQALFQKEVIDGEHYVGILFAASIHAHHSSPDRNAGKTEIAIGPASGIGKPVKVDSTNAFQPSILRNAVYLASKYHPQDEKLLFSAECSQDKIIAIVKQCKRFHDGDESAVHKLMLAFSPNLDLLSKASSFHNYVFDTLQCATRYLRPDHVSSARLTMFMLSAWGHAAMELTCDAMSEVMNYTFPAP